MAQRAGRLVCPRCGANNFDTVAACRKCGAPLSGAVSAGVSAPPMAPPVVPRATSGYERPSSPSTGVAFVSAVPTGDPAVARRAALALALTIPWLGLPIGWAFMMVEDSRRQAIGRLCAVWSMIALVFHLLLMFVLVQPMISMAQQLLLPMATQMMKGREASGGGDPTIGLPSR